MSPNTFTLDHPLYTMRFKENGRLEWNAFLDSDGTNWLEAAGPLDILWRVAFRAKDGTAPTYTSAFAEYEGRETRQDSRFSVCRLTWSLKLTPAASCRVWIDIETAPESPLSLWRISVQVPGGWAITSIEFPIVPGIRRKDRMLLYAPSGWGVSYPLEPGLNFEGPYPSWASGVQMMAVQDAAEQKGLYVAAHDPEGALKTLHCRATAESACCSISHPLSLVPHPDGIYTIPWPAAIGFYRGDYFEAAQIYRGFSYTTRWGGPEQPSWLDRVPAWFREIDLWLRPDGAAEDNLDITLKALEYFDVPTALHWYRWHQIVYDTMYPDYLPPKDGFKEAIATFQKAGARVTCYINGRLCDPASNLWQEKNAASCAARKDNGDCYTEIYGSHVPNNAMCPFTELWQNTIAGLVRTLTGEYGLDGVYIDQISAAAGVPCHNEKHGHPPGGGTFWREGYCRLLDACRNQLAEGKILTTEENAECWINQIEGHLTVNTPVAGCRPIPLFPAIYSDRTLCIATLYYAKDEPQCALPFRYKNAWAFLWGAQLGWIQPKRIMHPDAEKQALYLKQLAKVRKYARPCITGGRFLGMRRVTGENPRNQLTASAPFGGTYPIDEDAVMASLWQSSGGRLALLITNVNEECCSILLDNPAPSANIEVYDHTGRLETLTAGPRINLKIEGLQSLVLLFGTASNISG